MEQIPDVSFRKRVHGGSDFEIITLHELFQKRSRFPHRLDRPHRLDFYSVLFFTKGLGKHFIDFRSYPYEPGTLIFTAKGQVHAFEFENESEGSQIIFTEAFLQRHFIRSDSFSYYRLFACEVYSPIIRNDATEYEDFLSLVLQMQKEYERDADFVSEDITACLLKLLLLKAERIAAWTSPPIADPSRYQTFLLFKRALEAHCADTRDAVDYAATLNISYKYLNDVCKELTSLTAKRFIDEWVVLEIKRRLAGSSSSIKEIAHDMGFDEPTNLVKYFKQRTGQTPTQFKRSFS